MMVKEKSVYVWLLVLAATAVILAGCSQPHEFAGAELPESEPVPDFTLTGADEQPVSLSDSDGKYRFVYFGYTFCPDICPATLAELAEARRLLGEDADEVQVVMVTVDPERDTPQQLAEYVSHFDPTFIGLSGAKAEIDEAGKAYGVYYEIHEGTAETGYLVDHTTRAYLLDRERNAIVAYPFDARAEAIAADLAWLLENE